MESSCAAFFAQACPNSFARFEALLATSEAPPSPPPPPFPPLTDAFDENHPNNLLFVQPQSILNEQDPSETTEPFGWVATFGNEALETSGASGASEALASTGGYRARRELSLETSYDRVRTYVIVSQTNWLGWDFGMSVDEL